MCQHSCREIAKRWSKDPGPSGCHHESAPSITGGFLHILYSSSKTDMMIKYEYECVYIFINKYIYIIWISRMERRHHFFHPRHQRVRLGRLWNSAAIRSTGASTMNTVAWWSLGLGAVTEWVEDLNQRCHKMWPRWPTQWTWRLRVGMNFEVTKKGMSGAMLSGPGVVFSTLHQGFWLSWD